MVFLKMKPLQPSHVALPAAVPQGTPVALLSPILCPLSRPHGVALRLGALGTSPLARGGCRRGALAA